MDLGPAGLLSRDRSGRLLCGAEQSLHFATPQPAVDFQPALFVDDEAGQAQYGQVPGDRGHVSAQRAGEFANAALTAYEQLVDNQEPERMGKRLGDLHPAGEPLTGFGTEHVPAGEQLAFQFSKESN